MRKIERKVKEEEMGKKMKVGEMGGREKRGQGKRDSSGYCRCRPRSGGSRAAGSGSEDGGGGRIMALLPQRRWEESVNVAFLQKKPYHLLLLSPRSGAEIFPCH